MGKKSIFLAIAILLITASAFATIGFGSGNFTLDFAPVKPLYRESLAYPFVRMPFDLADFGLRMLKKVPLIGGWAEKAYNSKFLTSKVF